MKTKVSNLHKVIKAQWYLVLQKKGFWFSFWVMMLLNISCYLSNVRNGLGIDVFSMSRSTDYFSLMGWGGSISYITVFFPFLVVFPVAFISYDEELGKCSVFGIVRSSCFVYYVGKAVVAFLTGIVIIWIPFGLNILWNLITFKGNMNGYEGMLNSQIYFEKTGVAFEEFYKLHPLEYEILFIVIVGTFAGICSLFAYCVGNYIKKYKVFCTLPVYVLFFVTRALGFQGWILDDYISCPLAGSNSFSSMLIIEGIMIVISCILLGNYIKKKEFI